MTDADALTRYVRFADAEAFSALVRRYESLVFGVCVRQLGRGADAEDAAQLTFMKLARAATTIQNKLEGTLGAWLHTTAARTAMDLGRQRSTRRKHETAAAQLHAEAAARDERDVVAEAAAMRELSAEVDAALLELADDQRTLIVEVFLRGRSQRQVAKATGKCQARVCRELKSAVATLRGALSRRGVLVPAGSLLAGLAGVGKAGAAVPTVVSAGCTKVGLMGVGTGLNLGVGSASSVRAWAPFVTAGSEAGGRSMVAFWLLVGALISGLGMVAVGCLGPNTNDPQALQIPQTTQIIEAPPRGR